MDPSKRGYGVEEDDEFEEFALEDWGRSEQPPANIQLWDKSWDDEQLQDEVAKQIRTVYQNGPTRPTNSAATTT